MSALPDLSIAEAAEALRQRQICSVELTEAYLARIDARDPTYRSFVHVAGEQALAAARAADAAFARGEDLGPLHGIPIGVKDLFDTVDMPTTYGSDVFSGHRPDADAAVVARLRAGGAVILGKLETYEFAMVGPVFDRATPPATNPWKPDHFTGGSSSGSASAVAGGLVRTALGSDTGGSVRSPSAYCGTVGFKPTYGALPLDGVFPLSPSFDHVGFLSASVNEALLTFDAVSGRTGKLAGTPLPDLAGIRVGYARDWFAADPQTHPAMLSALDTAASQFSLLGARVEEIALPDISRFEAAGAVIIHAEAYAGHKALMAQHGERYSRKVFQNILSGLLLDEADLETARRAAALLTGEVDARFQSGHDVILTVNTLTPALPFSHFQTDAAVWTPMRTLAFNVTGHPVMAMPAGFHEGLPLGLQLVGPVHSEARLGAIAQAYEATTDFTAIRPPRFVSSDR